MKINLKKLVYIPILSSLLFFISCAQPAPRFERVLGTVCFINLYEDGKNEYYDEIFARLQEIDSKFNYKTESSDLYNINHFADQYPVSVSEDVFTVLQTAQEISLLTGGAFDVSVEPLVKLWNINSSSPHVATKEELTLLLPLVDYKSVLLNKENKSVRLLKKGMSLDLGGIAKGFAADEVKKICAKHKISRAIIDLGGNIYVYGEKKNSKYWSVGIKNPEYPDDVPLIKISVPQVSVVTSGVYERFFEKNEKYYHHILSPWDGNPVENELSSVSVISSSSMLADGLTTAFFVLGKEKTMALIPSIREHFKTDFSVIFIEKDKTVTYSDNFPYKVEILYKDWKISS